MDRSFLSQPNVIAAAQPFVCIRLTTYEDKKEGAFLKSFHVTGSGELENTVFAILSPDGKRPLVRASRSARDTFGDADQMAVALTRIAHDYEAKSRAGQGLPALPLVANVRLAVDVAACDHRPLVVLYAPRHDDLERLEAQLTPLAWSDDFLGRFIYVRASQPKELEMVSGVSVPTGVLIVQPDRFGQHGNVLTQVAAAAPANKLVQCLQEGLEKHQPESESFRVHVRAGHEQGIFWQTVIPVTDPMERRAREQGRRP